MLLVAEEVVKRGACKFSAEKSKKQKFSKQVKRLFLQVIKK